MSSNQEQIHRTAEPHSVEIKRDTKGEPTYTVKVYSDDEADAAKRAVKVYRELEKQLPKG